MLLTPAWRKRKAIVASTAELLKIPHRGSLRIYTLFLIHFCLLMKLTFPPMLTFRIVKQHLNFNFKYLCYK